MEAEAGRSNRVLDPSWTRVDRFSPSGPLRATPSDAMELDRPEREESGWEYEETEELVTLDLGPESRRLLQMSHQYSITGLESNQPFLRLGNIVFRGHWDQLIGTEIILKDESDPSKPAPFQHNIQPLPASETEIRTGKAPSTTRNRIQFRPAANMVAREEALNDPTNPSLLPPVNHKSAWVWVRGRGWLRKDEASVLEGYRGKRPDQQAAQNQTTPVKKKVGRKKMTAEEKMRVSIWKSLQKIDRMGDANGQEGDGQGGAEEGEEDGDEDGDEDDDEDDDEERAEGEEEQGEEDEEEGQDDDDDAGGADSERSAEGSEQTGNGVS